MRSNAPAPSVPLHQPRQVLAIGPLGLQQPPSRQLAEVGQVVADGGQHVGRQRARQVVAQQVVVVELVAEARWVLEEGHGRNLRSWAVAINGC